MSSSILPVGSISRLAVAAKDFSTYFIPNVTFISGLPVREIVEDSEDFKIIGPDRMLLSRVSKGAPYVADFAKNRFEQKWSSEFLNEDKTQQLLVDFGNFLFGMHTVHVKDSAGKDAYLRMVTDADLKNFEELLRRGGFKDGGPFSFQNAGVAPFPANNH